MLTDEMFISMSVWFTYLIFCTWLREIEMATDELKL